MRVLAALAALAVCSVLLHAQNAPPVEAGPFRVPDLVELTALDPTIRLDVRYARADNLVGRVLYAEARVFLQRPAAEAVVRAHRSLREQGYGLVVFDGYRPWHVTKLLWDATPGAKRAFVADPSQGSKHNRGSAVDLSLVDLATGAPLEMAGDYDEMSERSYPTYAGGTPEERVRRDRLRAAMEREGFFVHTHEWWHFDHAAWREYPILDLPFSALQRSAPPRPPLDVASARVVDLTHVFDGTTLYWPSAASGFELERLSFGLTPGGWFYAANAFCAPEHGGTHLDAPVHFARDGHAADAVELSRLVSPAVVIDVREKTRVDRDYRLSAADVRAWELVHGTIPRGAAVLLRTGWSGRWPDRKAYFGDDTRGKTSDLHFPAFGGEAAELLVGDRGVAGLGLDTPSLDHGPSTDFPVHRIAAARNVAGFENLTNLDALPATGAWLVALPLKIGSGSGAPLRAVALVGPAAGAAP